MIQTHAIIQEAIKTCGADKTYISFSGGSDSMVLLDIIYRDMGLRLPIVYIDTGIEYPETLEFIRDICARYNAGDMLHIVKPTTTHTEQWNRYGLPMLGKIAAIKFMRSNPDLGFRIDVSGCCQNLKLKPVRKYAKEHGWICGITGTKGKMDDSLRKLRNAVDGAFYRLKSANIWTCNPLSGLTDLMIRRYTKNHKLPEHPLKKRGAQTIGCMYCGGGAQFRDGGLRILHDLKYDSWRWFVVEWAGYVILAIKHRMPIDRCKAAVEKLGGLEHLVDTKPWLFWYLRTPPLNPRYIK